MAGLGYDYVQADQQASPLTSQRQHPWVEWLAD